MPPGHALEQLELPYSALIAYSKALAIDPQGVGSRLERRLT